MVPSAHMCVNLTDKVLLSSRSVKHPVYILGLLDMHCSPERNACKQKRAFLLACTCLERGGLDGSLFRVL